MNEEILKRAVSERAQAIEGLCRAAFNEGDDTSVIVLEIHDRDYGRDYKIVRKDSTAYLTGKQDADRELLNANADLLAENKRLKEAMEWQPIETAPKDKMVILGLPDFESDEGWVVAGEYCEHGVDDGAGWYNQFERDCQIHPTHWMPLPTPPQEKTR
jgi:hypothetical protein